MVIVHVFRFLAKIANPAKNANFRKKIPGGEQPPRAQTYKVFETL